MSIQWNDTTATLNHSLEIYTVFIDIEKRLKLNTHMKIFLL